MRISRLTLISANESTWAAPPSAGMVWRAAAAVELGICDAVLAVVPGSAALPHVSTPAAAAAELVWGVEQQLRVAAGRV